MWVTFKKDCPRCGRDQSVRIQRRSWMRMMKKSHLYECNLCRIEFLVLHSERPELISSLLDETSADLTSSSQSVTR
jgi:uncharacterized C2H2 Zn-finger protein